MPGFFCQPMGLTFQWCRSDRKRDLFQVMSKYVLTYLIFSLLIPYVCKAKFVALVKLHQGQVQDLTKK